MVDDQIIKRYDGMYKIKQKAQNIIYIKLINKI